MILQLLLLLLLLIIIIAIMIMKITIITATTSRTERTITIFISEMIITRIKRPVDGLSLNNQPQAREIYFLCLTTQASV